MKASVDCSIILLLSSLNYLVFLLLFLLALLKDVNLLEDVAEGVHLVDVKGLYDEEHKRKWTNSELFLALFSHHLLSLLVCKIHEDVLELSANFLGEDISEECTNECKNDLFHEPFSAPFTLPLGNLLANAASDEDANIEEDRHYTNVA